MIRHQGHADADPTDNKLYSVDFETFCKQNWNAFGQVVEIQNKGKCHLHFQISTWKYLNFSPNLHNEDDVIWYWTYYKKWSSNHNLSAYEIWTNLDQWLLRYETKKNACCAHAHCECLVRFTTGYLGRVHGYQQKPSMTLYILNVIFTFKIAVKDFKCGRGKSKFYI